MELKDFLINNPRQLPENAGKPLNANLRYWIADYSHLQISPNSIPIGLLNDDVLPWEYKWSL